MESKVEIGSTKTSEGDIPHLPLNGILCPVKLDRYYSGKKWLLHKEGGHPKPLYKKGRLVFALPGGKEVLS